MAIGAPVQAPSNMVVPDWARYRFFFLHLANLDKLAAKKDARGEDGSKWRTHTQRAAGLTETEGQVMKEVAFECNQAVSDVTAQMDALTADYKNQVAGGQRPTPPTEQRRQLAEKRIAIINAHIDRLRVMLGDESFQKVETYLKETFKAEVKVSPTPPAQGATR
jgi:hypothetical protein